MQRLRSSVLSGPNLKKKYLNSRAAIEDTFFSTKDTFERHRVVFTVGTSIASVATAWFGYSLRHLHDTKVDQRLQSIENAMKNNTNLQHSEIKDIVAEGCSIPACVATAGTSLIIGYALGWRGGIWYATKKFRKEQMKMLGQITPKRWQLLGKVTTQDGYILNLARIRIRESRGPPVLLQHGLFMDGITWLLLPSNQSLAFLLVDNGFDVWVANTRGTKFSRQHTSLPSNSSDYWNWSWDELVAHDLPATFKYVHDLTGQKMHYVGHSQGTLIALAALSQDQLLNMLRSAALLSPIAYVGQLTSPLAKNAAENFIAESLYNLGIFEFNMRGDSVIKFLKDLCNNTGIDCTNLLTSFTGQNCCLNPSIVNVFLDHEPQSTATKNMIHLSQMIREGTTSMFDYENRDENMKHYGQPTPPVYDMTRLPNDLPIFLSYGGADALSDVKDVQRLLEILKDHDADKLVVQYRNDYAHADYVMGENAHRDVYEPLISFFRLQ
ncbi:triacylglycerol lipase 2-like isoform X2 [Glycine soja]|uniref:triacylglycerol lipase 2-like isoform X2 n=1 Tax=Glycine soja TaxID=3848 RepID=UPI0003DEC85A|nr:triacylglycerol lipase 2-like isoform X2 [Glycine soja]